MKVNRVLGVMLRDNIADMGIGCLAFLERLVGHFWSAWLVISGAHRSADSSPKCLEFKTASQKSLKACERMHITFSL